MQQSLNSCNNGEESDSTFDDSSDACCCSRSSGSMQSSTNLMNLLTPDYEVPNNPFYFEACSHVNTGRQQQPQSPSSESWYIPNDENIKTKSTVQPSKEEFNGRKTVETTTNGAKDRDDIIAGVEEETNKRKETERQKTIKGKNI